MGRAFFSAIALTICIVTASAGRMRAAAQDGGSLRMHIRMDTKFDGLLLSAHLWPQLGSTSLEKFDVPHRIEGVVIENGRAAFEIRDIDSMMLLTLVLDRYPGSAVGGAPVEIFGELIAQPGDDLHMVIRDTCRSRWMAGGVPTSFWISFEGRGSRKYRVGHNIQVNASRYHLERSSVVPLTGEGTCDQRDMEASVIERRIGKIDSIWKEAKTLLESMECSLEPDVFTAYYLNALAGFEYHKAYYVFGNNAAAKINRLGVALYSRLYDTYLRDSDMRPELIHGSNARFLFRYADYLRYKEEREAILDGLAMPSASKRNVAVVDRILLRYDGPIRDYLLLNAYLVYLPTYGYSEALFTSLDAVMVNPYCRARLSETRAVLKPGDYFHDFELPDQSGRYVGLSALKGKVVFLDFWFSGCYGCITFHKATVSRLKEIFKGDSNVVFMTVSVDADREVWVRNIKSGMYTDPEALNLYTDGQGGKHPLIRKLKLSAYPAPFLLDTAGRVAEAGLSAFLDGQHIADRIRGLMDSAR